MNRCWFVGAAAAAASAAVPASALGQGCTPVFSSRFVSADLNNTIQSMRVFNDGSGPALYAGGAFTIAGGRTINRVARWTQEGWEPLGAGLASTVNALVVFDDGSGPALYAAGAFTTSPTVPATQVARIARWTGSTWAPLGAGLNATANAMAVWDPDGAGPSGDQLFVGGDFTTAGGPSATRLARWDGANWFPLGGGVDASVRTMTVATMGAAKPSTSAGCSTRPAGRPLRALPAGMGHHSRRSGRALAGTFRSSA